jgi:ATP-dependent helicase/nuclease subunit A
MRSPNSEQELAIRHHGGALLSAGAGSGKTFVLIEHIIYLIKDFSEQEFIDSLDFSRRIKKFLSKIVLMTFTNKAAGELSIRMKDRIRQEIEQDPDGRWEFILEAINNLNISTIHGFCFRLINQNFFSHLPSDIKIISDIEFRAKIESLCDKWLEQRESDQIGNIFLVNRVSVVDSLAKIFSDPLLRTSWKDLNIEVKAIHQLDDFFNNYLELSSFNDIFNLDYNLNDYEDKKTTKWYEYLNEFSELAKLKLTSSSYLSFVSFFKKFKGVRSPGKKVDQEILDVFEKLKIFRKFLFDNEENFSNYIENYSTSFKDWERGFKSLIDYIEENYLQQAELTFSDLEYYVLNSLRDDKIVDIISKEYSYFIIDEFQDTSYVQFDIVTKLIEDNYDKLFCVGDIKQAIYGFRGGELEVFLNCQKKVSKDLSLENNYRSSASVINFNNNLFEYIFKKGFAYEGLDKFSVPVQFQKVPENGIETDGRVTCLSVDLKMGKEKISNAQLNRFESRAIFNEIVNISKDFEGETIAILYKKLAPSLFLIEDLLESGLSTSAQMKISLGEEPVFSLMKILLEYFLTIKSNEVRSTNATLLLVKCHLDFMGIKPNGDLVETLTLFVKDIDTVGVNTAYNKFLFSLGISNSFYSNNMKFIDSLCDISDGDIEKLWILINNSSDSKYSIEFRMGDSESKVIIMSAHASKGLEFEHVILGGVHTNGREMVDSPFLGGLSESFKWKTELKQRKALKSPNYIYEELLKKRKNFSESKRLFYVACTRAEKTITWVDLNNEGVGLSYSNDSWILGIRKFQYNCSDILNGDLINFNAKISELDLPQDIKIVSKRPPLFHSDEVGVFNKTGDSKNYLGVVSELSVTRLAYITQCTRKFYLKNICKLDEDFFNENIDFDPKQLIEEEHLDISSDIIISNADRGTHIHESISKMILNFQSTDELEAENDPKLKEILNWVEAELAAFKEDSLISERPMKFSLFGHMISGTPDLVIVGKNRSFLEIWDFKTGSSNEVKEVPYWFQLACYAYACYESDYIGKDKKVKISLIYVDQQRKSNREYSYAELESLLFEQWVKLKDYAQVNQEHCGACGFGNICHVNL